MSGNASSQLTIDAYKTTGSSPTQWRGSGHPVRRATIHLLGPGRVGRALLPLLERAGCRVTAVTDTSATLHAPQGLSVRDVIGHKAAGGRIRDLPGARAHGPAHVLRSLLNVCADIVIDATATRFDRAGWSAALEAGSLDRGAALVLAAKDALGEAPGWWDHPRAGCNAVLGGTGRALAADLPALRDGWVSAALAGNASTTAIIEAIERGASLEDGITCAAERGFLEADPEFDLRGTDAAVKLAIVHGALTGRAVPVHEIACDDIREVDVCAIRDRAGRGLTTRLVGRADRTGALAVRYEALPADSPLAVPCDRVAYAYRLATGGLCVHVGDGLGAAATARAVLRDVSAFVRHEVRP